MEEFHEWLLKRSLQTPPQVMLGKAIHYTLEQWDGLIRYIDNGWLRPDNNLIENDIRPFAIGRKKWLFNGHLLGAEAGAILYKFRVSLFPARIYMCIRTKCATLKAESTA